MYRNGGLVLKRGTTTVKDALETAGIQVDLQNVYIPAGGDGVVLLDPASTNPLYMVSVNGVSYGVFTKYQLDNGQKTVQLHDGDAVRVARIPTPIQGYEASTGYDTTAWSYSTTSQISDFGSSLAAIQIDSISDGLKVGDKAKICLLYTSSLPRYEPDSFKTLSRRIS